MLDQLDLVHMNGRVYDPLVARFVSGDPILQDPIDGQNYNRYSYVLNNPTNNTDPTGFQAMTGTRLENVDTGAGCSGGCDFPLMRKRYNLNGAGQPAEGQRKEVGGKISAKAGSGGPTIGQRVSNFFSQAMRSFGIFDNFVPSRESFESGARQLLGGPCEHNCAGHDAMAKSTADVMQGAAQGVAEAGNRYYPELAKNAALAALPVEALAAKAATALAGREITLVGGFYQAEGSAFKFSQYYYEKLWNTGRGAPFLQAEEVLKTATRVVPDRMKGFNRYENGTYEMIYNPSTKEVWHLQPRKQ